MPLHSGARNIIFFGHLSICPSIHLPMHPDVHPSEAWNIIFSLVHGSVGLSDQPWPFFSPSICLSVRPSIQRGFLEISWRMHGGNGLKFSWCILATFTTDWIMIMVCRFSSFWHHFDLVKQLKFGVSRHFPEISWRQRPQILHVDVSWLPSELIRFSSCLIDFFILVPIWLSEHGHIWGFHVLSGEHLRVNILGERRHISDTLHWVLCSFPYSVLFCVNSNALFKISHYSLIHKIRTGTNYEVACVGPFTIGPV